VDSDATKVVNLDTPLRADGTDIRRVVTVFEKHPPDRLVLAHETGHVFDLPDLYHRPSDGKGDWDTYVGDWDLMGSQFGLAPDLFGWHKWKLGWLDPRQVVCGRGTGPYAADPGTAGGGARGGRGGFEAFERAAVFPGRGIAGVRVRERDETGGGADRDRQRARLRGARPGRQRRTVCSQGVLVYRVRAAGPSPAAARSRSSTPTRVRGLLGRLGLPTRSPTRRSPSARASPCRARTYAWRWRTGRLRGRGR
jgi:M6 family metalloprotease-like protein